jgi:hypothetical protein
MILAFTGNQSFEQTICLISVQEFDRKTIRFWSFSPAKWSGVEVRPQERPVLFSGIQAAAVESSATESADLF